MDNKPFELYKIFIALKTHFTNEEYDCVKMNYHIKSVSKELFDKRRDKKQFYNLSQIVKSSLMKSFLISQFIYNNISNVYDILNEPLKAQKKYDLYKENNINLLGNLQCDIVTIAKYSLYEWKNLFCQEGIDYPLIFKLVLNNSIRIETYCLLDDIFCHSTKKYDNLVSDTLYNTTTLKYRKYGLLLIKPSRHQILKMLPKDLNVIKNT